jgi:outer membrane protein OmpA-like peptidoglycan-associated protein
VDSDIKAEAMKRLEPWPVISDLFCGLLVACFATLVIFSTFAATIIEEEKTRVLIDSRMKKVASILSGALKPPVSVKKCDVEDLCVSVLIRFDKDRDGFGDDYRSVLNQACESIRTEFQGIPEAEREEIFIQIEGHTDKQQPAGELSQRERYLHNWNLSAKRAASVLYEFDSCGLSRQIRMAAVGLADTRPECMDETPACFEVNRRTTFRIRPDRVRIADRVRGALAVKTPAASKRPQ